MSLSSLTLLQIVLRELGELRMGPEGQLLALKEHGLGQPTGHSSFAPRKKEAQLYHLPIPVPVHQSPLPDHGTSFMYHDVECDRSDSARLYSVSVLCRSPPSVSSRSFFVNKHVSCTTRVTIVVQLYKYKLD